MYACYAEYNTVPIANNNKIIGQILLIFVILNEPSSSVGAHLRYPIGESEGRIHVSIPFIIYTIIERTQIIYIIALIVTIWDWITQKNCRYCFIY
jgi:hypothetical protein